MVDRAIHAIFADCPSIRGLKRYRKESGIDDAFRGKEGVRCAQEMGLRVVMVGGGVRNLMGAGGRAFSARGRRFPPAWV